MTHEPTIQHLRGKRILLISPDRWGAMHISKHHYAKTLAKLGNTVFFLNPPSDDVSKSVDIQEVKSYPGLFVVDYKRSIPRFLRFKLRSVYDRWMNAVVKKISKEIGPVDLVWCFEPNLYHNPKLFATKAEYIFHPVDELYYPYQYVPGDHADLILASAQEYLNKFGETTAPRVFINHGLANYFIEAPKNMMSYPKSEPVRVGYAGNMLRPEIDREIFLLLIEQQAQVEFHIWGSYKPKDSNLSAQSDSEADAFVNALSEAQNVILHGPVPPTELALAMQEMDAFLICYDVKRDRSSGTNYHKVMEYLNTGKVVISNNVTTYKGQPDLVQMVEERDHNRAMPALFEEVIQNLAQYNHPELQQKRIDYSLKNSYLHQIERIEDLLYSTKNQAVQV